MDIYSIINTIVTIFLGGGWFLHWRASRRKAEGEAKHTEAQANREAQEYYNKTLEDVNRTLNDVRAERDGYKSERDEERRANDEMREKYNQLEEKVARLGRRLDCLSPFLCGVAGCMHRKKVSLMEDIDDNSYETYDNESNNGKGVEV